MKVGVIVIAQVSFDVVMEQSDTEFTIVIAGGVAPV
jgi:hypothetical protein